MKILSLFLAILLATGAAVAQTRPSTGTNPTGANATNAGGAATVKSHMQSQGYKDIHELRQGPDGQWTGKATQNGVGRTVTVQPNGSTTAR
jgi:uncharacterized protein (DUF2147 family)